MRICGLLWALVIGLAPGAASAQTGGGDLYLGGILAMTGPIAAASRPHAEGVLDYIKWINDHGGLSGKKINMYWEDYQYSIPAAFDVYKKILAKGRPLAIVGTGTGDTMALLPKINVDRIPYFAASYSDDLADGRKTPYNFFVGATYNDQMKVALDFIKRSAKGPGKPRVAFAYLDNAFGRGPIPFGKTYAAKIGIDVVPDAVLNPKAGDYDEDARLLALANVDSVVIQGIGATTKTLSKSFAKTSRFKPQVVCLNYAVDEIAFKDLGAAAEGLYAVMSLDNWDEDDQPGVRFIRELRARYHTDAVPPTHIYVHGVVIMMVIEEALRRAGPDPTPERLKAAIETIKNLDLHGLGAPLTFTPERHNGSTALRIRQYRNGQLVAVSDYISAR